MPLIQILSYSQKKEFETPPILNNESRKEIFSLPLAVERQMIAIALAILQNGKEKLLTFGWFSVCYWWVVQKLEKLHSSQLYRQTNLWIKKLRKNFDNRSSRVSRLIGHLYYRLRNSI